MLLLCGLLSIEGTLKNWSRAGISLKKSLPTNSSPQIVNEYIDTSIMFQNEYVPPSSPELTSNESSPKTSYRVVSVPEKLHAITDIKRDQFNQFNHRRFLPNTTAWTSLEETLPGEIFGVEGTVKVTLDPKVIGKTAFTAVYSLLENPNWAIKYHNYCFDSIIDPIDTTLVESWFLEKLATAGITHKIIYFSRHVEGLPSGGKLPNVSCPDNPGVVPVVRYMITERVGMSVNAFLDKVKTIPFRTVMKIGGQMIELIERLHRFDTIHGDVHGGNFAFRDGKVILIDFGRARIVDSDDLLVEPKLQDLNSIGYWFYPVLSMWETEWFKPSYRDDMFRLVQLVASLVFRQR